MASNEQANNHHSEHHVHFDDLRNDDFVEDNGIQYHGISNKGLAIGLGFLQVNHRYEVELKIPIQQLCSKHDLRNLNLVEETTAVPNINCRLIEVTGIKDGVLIMKLNFFASKEKLMKENFNLVNEGREATDKLKLIITARVLGRGKGTPMLRNGIHCIGIEADEDSDVSDWVGFSRNDTDDDL